VVAAFVRVDVASAVLVVGPQPQGRNQMPRYLVTSSYTPEGIKGLLKKGGTARVEASRQAVEAMGGKLHSFDFTFGADDAILIIELPDNASAAAISLTVAATGLVASRIVPLVSPAEIDEAAKKSVAYTPPGG
jgi:uncharacterized protein with GYD domain